jgi:hypothetical protein
VNPFVLLLVVANILSADAREANVCPYYSVFVESERDDTERSQSTGWEAAEPARLDVLRLAESALPGTPMHLVQHRASAHWILSTSASSMPQMGVGVGLGMQPTLAFESHLAMALLQDDGFPTGDGGGARRLHSPLPGNFSKNQVRSALESLWGDESEAVEALCAWREELGHEGWGGVEELRSELLQEMKRVRRIQAETQHKEPEARP